MRGRPRVHEQPASISSIDPARLKVVACEAVAEEFRTLLPERVLVEVIDFGLHHRPGSLTEVLQGAIDRSGDVDAILLGYGMCSHGVIGLRATTAMLVIPRVDDCIAMMLGSRRAYQEEMAREPGTYFLSKGWLEGCETPLDQERRMADRYGEEQAARMVEMMLRGYQRLAFIDTSQGEAELQKKQAEKIARRFGLRFEELQGTPSLLHKLLLGPWDEQCVVVSRGDVVLVDHFLGKT